MLHINAYNEDFPFMKAKYSAMFSFDWTTPFWTNGKKKENMHIYMYILLLLYFFYFLVVDWIWLKTFTFTNMRHMRFLHQTLPHTSLRWLEMKNRNRNTHIVFERWNNRKTKSIFPLATASQTDEKFVKLTNSIFDIILCTFLNGTMMRNIAFRRTLYTLYWMGMGQKNDAYVCARRI